MLPGISYSIHVQVDFSKCMEIMTYAETVDSVVAPNETKTQSTYVKLTI